MTKRDRVVLLVVLAAAAVAAFWFAVLGPKRDEAAKLSNQIAEQRTRLNAARQQLASAEQARGRYEQDYATVARLGKAVPVQEDVPSLVYQLESAAREHRIDFRALKLDAAPAGQAAAAPPAAQVAQAGADANGAPAQPGSPGTSGAPAQSSSPGTPPAGTPVGAAGFPVMPFSFTFDGSFFDMEHFLRELDRLTFMRKDTLRVAGRLLTINGVTLSAGRKGFPTVQAQVQASAFQLPADEGLTAGATPQGPAQPGAQPQPSAGGGPPTPTATGGTR